MAETILIHPENRLLGSPGGDLSLAAAPFSFADYRPAITHGGAHPVVPDSPPAAVAPLGQEAGPGTGRDVAQGDLNGASTVFRQPSDSEATQSVTGAAPDPPSLAQVQQSSLTPISLTQPLDTPGADRAMIDPATTPAAEVLPVQAAPMQEAVQATPLQEGAGAAPALPASLPLATETGNIVSPLPDAIDLVSTLNFLPTLTAPSLVLPALPAIDIPVIGDLTGLIEASTGPLSGIVDEVEAGVSDLLGADPAGGVTTLVSLVSVTDIFDLRQIDDPSLPVSEEPVISLLDALGAEPPALLDLDDDDGAGGGLPVPVPVPLPPIIDLDPIGGLL